MKYLIPLIIFIIITAFFWQGLKKDPRRVPSALIGKEVPAFSSPSLQNPHVQITNQQFQGHVSLLNVWATWCISCRAEHPILMDIVRENKAIIYGLDYKDDPTSAKNWLKNFGNPYKNVIFDGNGTLAINLGVYGTPETFIIDQHGVIRDKYIGPISPQVWQEQLLPEIDKLKQEG